MTDFTSQVVDGTCTVTLAGEIDIAEVDTFLEVARAGLEEATRGLRIDLGAVSFIDSSGIGSLVRLRKEAQQRDLPFALENVPPSVHRVLEVTGLTDLFGLRSSR